MRINPAHPLYVPLRQIVLSTYGAPATIWREFSELDNVHAVLIFGSWAARYAGESGRAPNDIDVLVIGAPNRDAVDAAADRAENEIGLPVQATIRSVAQWDDPKESFIREIRGHALLVVLADENFDHNHTALTGAERFTP